MGGMKSSLFAVIWASFCLILTSGCTYTTEEQEKVIEVQEAQADAGAPDAQEGDGDDVYKDRGASGTKQLKRGDGTISTILTESFLEANGSSVASVYTLQFALTSKPIPPGSPLEPATRAYAIVTWSIGGNQIIRKISISNGATITGVGAGCSVQVYDATGQATNPPLTGADPVPYYDVIVTLTPGSRGESSVPPVYYPIPSAGLLPINPGTGTVPISVTKIPVNAGATSVAVTGFGAAAIPTEATVTQYCGDFAAGGSGAVVKQYRVVDYPGFVPLDPTATEVLIDNPSTANTLNWSIVFGIDG